MLVVRVGLAARFGVPLSLLQMKLPKHQHKSSVIHWLRMGYPATIWAIWATLATMHAACMSHHGHYDGDQIAALPTMALSVVNNVRAHTMTSGRHNNPTAVAGWLALNLALTHCC